MSSVLEKITTDAKRRSKAYSAYYQREEPAPDAELTQTGAGTPLGEYMRRFWQPVCLSSQLTDVPHAIRIMGENLVAFRDRGGRVGVLQRHCCHRGASLENGIIQDRRRQPRPALDGQERRKPVATLHTTELYSRLRT